MPDESFGKRGLTVTDFSGRMGFHRLRSARAPSPTIKPEWMPDFPLADVTGNNYVASPKELEAYLKRLAGEGFIQERAGDVYYISKDNVFITLYDDTVNSNECEIKSLVGMAETRPGALTCEQAKEIIGNGAVSVVELNAPDLYNITGAQLFYAVIQARGPTNYRSARYVIVGGKALPLEAIDDSYAVCDIDGDGKAELLYLSFGPTSGVYSFTICAMGFENGKAVNKYSSMFLPIQYYDLSLKQVSDTEADIISGSTAYPLVFQDDKIILKSCPWGDH